jgi:tetratricopeptide (TPR) repeat protein
MIISKIKDISNWVLLAVIGLLPVLFIPLSFVSVDPLRHFILFFVATIFSIGIIISKIKKDSFSYSTNLFFISIAFLFLSFVLSTIFSNNIGISLWGRQISFNSLFGLISITSFVYILYTYVLQKDFRDKVLLVLYSSALFINIMHLLFIIIPFLPALGFFTSTVSNTVGTWYEFGFFALFTAFSSVLILQFLGHSKIHRIVSLVGLIVSMLLVIIVNSTSVFVFAIVFSLLYIILNALKPYNQDINSRISYGAIAILILSTVFLLIGNKTGYFVNSFLNIQMIEPRPSMQSTVGIIQQVIVHEPILRKIFGVGLDRFDTAWLMYRPQEVNLTSYWDVDFRFGFSTITTAFVNQGIVGILAWVLFIITSVFLSVKLLFSSLKQKDEYFVSLYAVFGYLFFLAVLLFYVPTLITIVLFAVFFALIIARLSETGLLKYKKINLSKSPRLSFGYLLVLVVGLIGFIYIGYIHTSEYISRYVYERAVNTYVIDQNFSNLVLKTQKAQFIFNSDIYDRALTDISLIALQNILSNQTLSQEQLASQFSDTLKVAVQYAQAAVVYDNLSYVNRINLLKLYKSLIPLGVAQAKEESINVINETLKITPNNPTLFLEQARVYALAKDYTTAISFIQKALESKSNYVDAAFLLSQIQVEQGNIDQAIESIKAAIVIDQANPTLDFQLGLLYYNKDRFNDAVVYFEKAIMLSPEFSNARYFLGLSYYKNNRTADAIAIFEQLHTQFADNSEVSSILNNLKSGLDPFYGMQTPDNSPETREELPVEEKDAKVE